MIHTYTFDEYYGVIFRMPFLPFGCEHAKRTPATHRKPLQFQRTEAPQKYFVYFEWCWLWLCSASSPGGGSVEWAI